MRGVPGVDAAPIPPTAAGWCHTLLGMSSPEVERRLRQHGADLESLCEISFRIEGKVDRLAENTNARFDALDRSNEQTQALLTQIMERLDRD